MFSPRYDILPLPQRRLCSELGQVPTNPVITLKSLTYFGDGDLHRLRPEQKTRLIKIATAHSLDLPVIPRLADKLAPSW